MKATLGLRLLGGGHGLTHEQWRQLDALAKVVCPDGAAPPEDMILLLAGHVASVAELEGQIAARLALGLHPAIVYDCITGPPQEELEAYLATLHEQRIQSEKVLYWRALARADRHHISVYPPWELSVALLTLLIRGGDWTREPEIAVVQRSRGKPGICVPCGYVSKGESLEQAASREGQQEAGIRVDPAQLQLLYQDSSPRRDKIAFAPHLVFRYFAYHGEEGEWDKTIGHEGSNGETSKAWFMPIGEFIGLDAKKMSFEEIRRAAEVAFQVYKREQWFWQLLALQGHAGPSDKLPSERVFELAPNPMALMIKRQ